MKGFITNIEKVSLEKEYFRNVLYTLYAPPNHAEGTTHKTKAEAEAAEEHYHG